MASGDNTERTLSVVTIIDIQPDGQRTVIGMRPELNVLVPFHFLTAFGPFEIELGVMKLHIRPDKIGDDINEVRL